MRCRVATLLQLLGVLPLALACGPGEAAAPRETMPVHELARDLLDGEIAFEALTPEPLHAHEVGVISPALHHSRDGAGTPALIVPPGAEVRFTVPSGDGPAFLRGRCGADISVLRYLNEAGRRSIAFDFEVEVDGQPVFATSVDVRLAARPLGSAWVDIGGTAGVAVRPGAEVCLRTFARDIRAPKVARFAPAERLFVGFGRLRLARTLSVERVRSAPERPNVVLIVMDTLRTDRLSTYGYARETSPHLTRLAERGTLFEEGYATSSWTWPSTASLLTGLHPQEHGVVDKGSCFLAPPLVTLAEVLQQAGVTTGAFTGNPLISPPRNFHQGFEHFDPAPGEFRKTKTFFDDVTRWVEANAGRRFFLYLHLVEPHAPYEALPEPRVRLAAGVPADFDLLRYGRHSKALLRGEGHAQDGTPATEQVVSLEEQGWYSDLYDACVASGDFYLGEVVALLERLGLDDETVIAFTNDHGEELFDRGLMNHGQSLHGELVRAPLVLAGPGVPRGQRVNVPLSNRHLAPTLARLGGATLDTHDALDLTLPERLESGGVLFSTENGWWNGHPGNPIFGLRQGDTVFHFAPEGRPWGVSEGAQGQSLLFDLSSDPLERSDLSPASAERLRVLRTRVETTFRELQERRPAGSFKAGEATLEMLKRVGYL